ncbi:hypothetical protein TNCV_2849221 [Trichonephila clavipes]|nr:hypothetical protein TNCV_2849221 [Trichonephila clavipes]
MKNLCNHDRAPHQLVRRPVAPETIKERHLSASITPLNLIRRNMSVIKKKFFAKPRSIHYRIDEVSTCLFATVTGNILRHVKRFIAYCVILRGVRIEEMCGYEKFYYKGKSRKMNDAKIRLPDPDPLPQAGPD